MEHVSNKDLKDKLERKLREHFDRFVDLKINNVTVRIMPVENHVPKLSEVEFNEENDTLFVLLSNGDLDTTRTESVNENIDILFSTKSEKIIGFKIKGFSKLLFDKVERDMEKQLELRQRNLQEKSVSFQDVESRKLDFFSDLISNKNQIFAI